MKNRLPLFFTLAAAGLLGACHPSVPVPKPVGYYKVDLPEAHAYQLFDSAGFPFSFMYPVYAHITQDTQLVRAEHAPYWINVAVPQLDATIYLSYKRISDKEPLAKLMEESYKLSFAHDIKADYIKSPQFTTKNGLVGVFYDVGGNAASAYQFFITDTVRNFVRGALYFDVSPNADSLRPGTEFLKQDIEYLIQTLRFK